MRARTSVAQSFAALVLLVTGLASAAPPTATAAESLVITVDPDPIIDKPASITVTGTADSGRTLSIYAVPKSDGWRCWGPRSLQETIAAPAFNEPVAEGPIERTFTLTPDDVSGTRICARLHRMPGIWGDDTAAEILLTARRSHGTVTISAAPELTARVPAQVTVSGTTEVPRRLGTFTTSTGECGDEIEWNWSEPRGIWQEIGGFDPAVTVGPGAFTQTFTFSPTEYLGTAGICAMIQPARRYDTADAVAYLPVKIVEPPAPPRGGPTPSVAPPKPGPDTRPLVVVLKAPADGATGELLNPRFVWDPSGNQDRWFIGRDRLVIEQYLADGRTKPVLEMTRKEYRVLYKRAGLEFRDTAGSTDDVADKDWGGGGWLQLKRKHSLPPARYRWHVEREGHESPWSTFTVIAPHLRSLSVTVRREGGGTFREPGLTAFSIFTQPYARIMLSVRQAGGKWRSVSGAVGSSGTTHTAIPWTCKPGPLMFSWRVTASDEHGASRTESGRAMTMTSAGCNRQRRREAAAQRRYDRVVRRYHTNCRAIRGTPGWSVQKGKRYMICRGAGGRPLPVPGFDD